MTSKGIIFQSTNEQPKTRICIFLLAPLFYLESFSYQLKIHEIQKIKKTQFKFSVVISREIIFSILILIQTISFQKKNSDFPDEFHAFSFL